MAEGDTPAQPGPAENPAEVTAEAPGEAPIELPVESDAVAALAETVAELPVGQDTLVILQLFEQMDAASPLVRLVTAATTARSAVGHSWASITRISTVPRSKRAIAPRALTHS